MAGEIEQAGGIRPLLGFLHRITQVPEYHSGSEHVIGVQR